MSHAREQSIPLATKGYVLGVNQVFIQQTVLSDGTVTGGSINMSDVTRVAFSIEHAAVRMSIRAMGGVSGNVVRLGYIDVAAFVADPCKAQLADWIRWR